VGNAYWKLCPVLYKVLLVGDPGKKCGISVTLLMRGESWGWEVTDG